MISAKRAKQIMIESEERIIIEENNRLEGLIMAAAEQNKSFVEIKGDISDNAKKLLRECGYDVTILTDNKITIDW